LQSNDNDSSGPANLSEKMAGKPEKKMSVSTRQIPEEKNLSTTLRGNGGVNKIKAL
jgi:hypothetical protein